MKTLTHIKDKAIELGMSLEYPLRGRKEQQIQQMINWFRLPIDYDTISGRLQNPFYKEKYNQFIEFLT